MVSFNLREDFRQIHDGECSIGSLRYNKITKIFGLLLSCCDSYFKTSSENNIYLQKRGFWKLIYSFHYAISYCNKTEY